MSGYKNSKPYFYHYKGLMFKCKTKGKNNKENYPNRRNSMRTSTVDTEEIGWIRVQLYIKPPIFLSRNLVRNDLITTKQCATCDNKTAKYPTEQLHAD